MISIVELFEISQKKKRKIRNISSGLLVGGGVAGAVKGSLRAGAKNVGDNVRNQQYQDYY